MRDVYYQAVGNPVQLDRLPVTRPDLELPSPPLSVREVIDRLLPQLFTAMLVTFGVLITYRAPGWTFLEPYDLAVSAAAIIISVGLTVVYRDHRPLLHPLFFGGVALLCLNRHMPWRGQVLLAAASIGALTYCFGWHWSVVSTASPVPRNVASECRRRCRQYLRFAALVAAALIAATLTWKSAGPRLLIMAFIAAAIFAPQAGGSLLGRLRLLGECWSSWLTYEAQPLPGLLQSPVGSARRRRALTLWAVALTAVIFVRWSGSPVPKVIELGQPQRVSAAVAEEDGFTRFRHHTFLWFAAVFCVVTLSIVTPLVIASSLAMPALLMASATRAAAASASGVSAILADIRSSSDRIERDSIYYGRVVADGSPVCVPRAVHREHVHGLGDSGSGKTAMFLAPLIDQLVSFGDCSLIVIDLKADSSELLATLANAGDLVRRERGIPLPLKYFSNQSDRSTFAFNPLTQPFWSKLDLLTRTDILCGATGLIHGTDYGQGYYSSANAAILHHALKAFPHVATFSELAVCIGTVLTTAKKSELHPEIRKAGAHVHEVVKRLAACEGLNVTAATGHPGDVVNEAIDLSRVFREPQLHYFHLSSTLSPSGAPEIARLVSYLLLAAATQSERRCPVYLVIDEFQRMVAANLEYLLQLARSMDIGVILANQSLEDLKKGTTNLIPAIESNCRIRQWFSVSSSDDQERLMASSGVTIDHALQHSLSVNVRGEESSSLSASEQIVNRLSLNDILLTGDHPRRSILRISRGSGYAQYGGMPVIIESEYHISRAEYERRKAFPWPNYRGSLTPGSAAAGRERAAAAAAAPATPPPAAESQWSEEVIGGLTSKQLEKDEQASVEAMFRDLQESLPAPTSRKKPRVKP